MEKRYDEANNKYQDALLEDPASAVVQYNIGDVLYKKNHYDKTLEAFSKIQKPEDPIFQSQVMYNMGNALYRSNKLPESIQAYEQALKLNPDDQDAKYNLEFVRNKLKENAKPQQDQQQPQQNQENKPQDQNQDQKDKEQPKEQQQQNQSQDSKKEMSKEEAERLLQAMNEDQKKMKKEQVQAPAGVRIEKDW